MINSPQQLFLLCCIFARLLSYYPASKNSSLGTFISHMNDVTCNIFLLLTKISKLLSHIIEPRSYNETGKEPKWIESINEEICTLEENYTWEIYTLKKAH